LDAIHGNDTGNDGGSSAPWQSMNKAKAMVQPGDVVLLRPGNYGSVVFNGGYGSAAGGYVTYMADPQTTGSRPNDWFENGLDRPDPDNPGNNVILTGITFDYYASALDLQTKTGTAAGHFIAIEGLNVVGDKIWLNSYVADVKVKNCNIFGNWGEYSADITTYGLNVYRSYSLGSDYRNILIENCYIVNCRGGVILLGKCHNITVRGNYSHDCYSGGLRMQCESGSDSIYLESNHVGRQIPVADVLQSPAYTVVSPDGNEPDRIFTINANPNLRDFFRVTDATDSIVELRQVESYDINTHTVTLKAPLSFAVETGDKVESYDGSHGSGISIHCSNITMRGNRVHECGATRGLYFYTTGTDGYRNIVMENNLFYSTVDPYTVDINTELGDHCRIVNNTFVGKRGEYAPGAEPYMYHGIAIRNCLAAPNADPSTMIIANNLFVGLGSAPDGAIVRNNIVYAADNCFEQDTVGDNRGNLVYYTNELYGSEPHPFDGSGKYFVGGPLFDSLAFQYHGHNFNSAFRLAAGAGAIGFADPAYAPATDMLGNPRDAEPDAGCFEYLAATVIEGLKVENRRQKAMIAIPNPMVGDIDIWIDLPANVFPVNIYDLNGKLVKNISSQNRIAAGDLASGMYLIKMGTGPDLRVQKIVKVKK
jgi:hypothetical protein